MGSQPTTHDLTLACLASLVLATLMAMASAAGLLAPFGLYGGDPAVVSVFVGQDAANLVVGLPILLGSLWLVRRGSLTGLLLWPGALFFVLYTYALYLIGAPLGALFLVYVAVVVLAAYTTIGVVASIDREAVSLEYAQAPARVAGGILVGVGVLATLGLLALVIPALGSPGSVDPLLHARWIVDFTVGNPVLPLGGVLLWRRASLGYATAAGLLFLSGVNGIAFGVGGFLGGALTATPIDGAVIAVHLAIALASLVVLAYFLRDAKQSLPRTPGRAAPGG
jgi:hypothetical protein